MPFTDRTLTCVDCGAEFVFTADDQEFHASRGFTNEYRGALSLSPSAPGFGAYNSNIPMENPIGAFLGVPEEDVSSAYRFPTRVA